MKFKSKKALKIIGAILFIGLLLASTLNSLTNFHYGSGQKRILQKLNAISEVAKSKTSPQAMLEYMSESVSEIDIEKISVSSDFKSDFMLYRETLSKVLHNFKEGRDSSVEAKLIIEIEKRLYQAQN